MTQIWAHRGASAAAPENTLAAFELAARQGAQGVELDVQRSADGTVVVIHDETVDRTTQGSGRVVDLPGSALQAWGVPTLAEVLDLLAPTGLRVNVELKNGIEPYPGLEEDVEAVVSSSRLADEAGERVVYSSFNHRSLARLDRLGTRVPLGVLHVEAMVRPWVYAASFGARALHPMALTVLPEEVAQAHEAGMAVHVWTVDDPMPCGRSRRPE
ncbi:glycerophosphodiester phosphodiesterase family protein [Ornithinimicrobium flavum]|uniref:glycerophosphodiester phosphodiesterase family protein n=1 Tax=Ornithinimicrobium flavum TaxID=1288636 RepID=UPI001931145D|nr:glycerophosphodiester phosphodiesterase family protein [Ornithinimicrobium flavum]